MPGLATGTAARRGAAGLTAAWQAELDDHAIAVAWSPDGATLAAAAISGPITLFDAATGAVRRALPGHDFGTAALSWSPDGTLLASGGQDGRVRIWAADTGEQRWAADGGAAWVERVGWCPVAPLLASAAGRKLRLWDATGGLVRAYPDHDSTIADLAWKPGSRELTTAHYGGLSIWATDQDRDEPAVRHVWQGSTLVIAWSPDKKYIATGDQDSTVHFWIARTGKDLQMFGYPTKVRELAWNCGSRYLATGGGDAVVVWDCSGRGPRGTTPLMLEAHKENLSALAFQQVGLHLASGGEDGRVVLWYPGKSKTPLAQTRYPDGISQLHWSPDDKTLAVGTEAGTVEVLTVAT